MENQLEKDESLLSPVSFAKEQDGHEENPEEAEDATFEEDGFEEEDELEGDEDLDEDEEEDAA